jgi:threonine dehydratase
VGGGGLVSGVALAVKARRPAVRIIGVQAAAVPGMARALEARERVRVPAGATIADGIAVRQVGQLTFTLASRLVDEMVTADEEELANAVLLLLEIEKTVVEGAGAAPLAALLHRRLGLAGRRVALVLSGGNIDVTMLARIIERGLVKAGRLVRLGVVLDDRPGALARLTALIAEERVNILQIEHDRAFVRQAIGSTEVELTLETTGRTQIDALAQRLEAAGYAVEERGS